jgi:hypothetical protein
VLLPRESVRLAASIPSRAGTGGRDASRRFPSQRVLHPLPERPRHVERRGFEPHPHLGSRERPDLPARRADRRGDRRRARRVPREPRGERTFKMLLQKEATTVERVEMLRSWRLSGRGVLPPSPLRSRASCLQGVELEERLDGRGRRDDRRQPLELVPIARDERRAVPAATAAYTASAPFRRWRAASSAAHAASPASRPTQICPGSRRREATSRIACSASSRARATAPATSTARRVGEWTVQGRS